jgi:IPT/TIG domain
MSLIASCCCVGCGPSAGLLVSQMASFPGKEYYFPADYTMSARRPGGTPIKALVNGVWVDAYLSNIVGNVAWNNSSVITNLNSTPYLPTTFAWDKYFMAPIYPQDPCSWVFWVDNPPLFRSPPITPMGYKVSQIQAYPGVTGECVAFNAITTQHLGFESKTEFSSCSLPGSVCPGLCVSPCVVMILRVRITGQFNRTAAATGCNCSGPGSFCGVSPSIDFKHCCAINVCNCCDSVSCGSAFSFCRLPDKFITDAYYRSYWNGSDTLKEWLERPFNLYRISSNFTDGVCGAPGDIAVCRSYIAGAGWLEYDACKTKPGGESFSQADIDSMPCDWENIPLQITPVYNPLVPDVSTVKSLDVCGSLVNGTGTLTGGTLITITGDHLLYATGVTVDGIPCTDVKWYNNIKVTAVTPASATTGAKFVRVITPGGTSVPSAGDVFTYTANAAPATCAFFPAGGSTAGGTFLTLTGHNYTGVTAVTIGGIACTAVTVLHSGAITCITPAASPPGYVGGRFISVTSPFGSATAFSQWVYS